MKADPKGEVRKPKSILGTRGAPIGSMNCRRRRKETPFDSETRAFNQSLLTSSPTRFILRFAFGLFLGFRISNFGFSLLAQTNPATSDDLPPLLPPRPEIPPSFWEQHSVAIVLTVFVLASVVCALAWFVLRPKPPVFLPPAVQARAALEPLRGQPETGMLLSKISQIVRSYFVAAFHLPAGELTTAEFCRFLQNRDLAGPELSGAVGEFLRQCDHRKFAPLGPLPPLGAVAGAAQLIEEAEVKRAGLLASVGPS